MGAWAVLQAARQVALWLRAGLPAVPLAVNVSARQCMNRDIVQVVRLALQETGIPPHMLRLEITETTAMADADQVISLLHDIRALGVGLAVDDFGTGYSSLAYLKRFPIDELKIDRSFVASLDDGPTQSAVVLSILRLSETLNLETVAEGIEEPSQLALLRELGAELGQGYFFARPLDVDAVTALIEANAPLGEGAEPESSRRIA
jgi:EAL domain-containing protein (putative c-di-GMP-specific phosphodiesterase class I)